MHILFYRFCTVLWYWVIWLFCPGCIRFHFVSCSRFPLNAGFPQISGWQWSFFSSVLLCPCCDCPAQAGLGWRDGVWWCPPPPRGIITIKPFSALLGSMETAATAARAFPSLFCVCLWFHKLFLLEGKNPMFASSIFTFFCRSHPDAIKQSVMVFSACRTQVINFIWKEMQIPF